MRQALLATGPVLVLGISGCFGTGGSESDVVEPRNVFVDANSSTGAATGTRANPYRRIQDALDAAIRYDRIQIAPGTYDENLDITTHNISLIGPSASQVTINGDGTRTVINIRNDRIGMLIQGLTITGGLSNDAGALDANNATITVQDCIFTNNGTGNVNGTELFFSGAVRFVEGNVTIRRCVFMNNQTRGLMLQNARNIRIENSIFCMNDEEGITLTGRSNTTAPDLFMTNVTVAGNGDNGLGVDNFGDARLTNVIFSNNSPGVFEFNDGGDPELFYCNLDDGYFDADTNTKYNNAGPINALDPKGTNIGNLTQDPMFVDAANGDLTLAAGSPCIDTGSPSIFDTDGSRSDMGAFGGPGGDWDPTFPAAATSYQPAPSVSGNLQPLFEFAETTARPNQPVHRDLNSDGLVDRLMIHGGRAFLFQAVDMRRFRPAPLPRIDDPVQRIAVHDLNADGHLDLVIETDRQILAHLRQATPGRSLWIDASPGDQLEIEFPDGRRVVQAVTGAGDDRFGRAIVGLGRATDVDVVLVRDGQPIEHWSGVGPDQILTASALTGGVR